MKNAIHIVLGVLCLICASCSCEKIETPSDTSYLSGFHLDNFDQDDPVLNTTDLSLFVDYSTCNKLGQNSQFFQDIAASLVNKTTAYYSIKGSEIQKEEGDVYTLLRNIEEVNYAELANAAQRMADGSCESVMITDGEYYTPSIAKSHDNDPYLANAFKTWILKGYDVHIISEPYVEAYNGQSFNKKRFYIMFTDDRMQNNIYERVRRTVDFTQFPDVDEFHISASHPQMKGNGNNCSTQNQYLLSKSKGFGTFEIQDWDGCDWGTIEDNLINSFDEETGDPLDKGETIIEMGIDKNSFGCYRIKSLSIHGYDINSEYSTYFEEKEAGGKPGKIDYDLSEIENFMEIDQQEFKNHSKINISFHKYFSISDLTGKPYNYFKVDLAIDEVEEIFRQHQDKFEFESITQPGTKNVSVASSIKQCLADDKVLERMHGQVIYSIYIKSEQN